MFFLFRFFGQSDYDCCLSHVTVEIMGVCTSKSADLEVVEETKQSKKSAAAHSDSRPEVGNGYV